MLTNHPGYYEECKKLSLQELAEARANFIDKSPIAQLVYEEKMMEQKHEFDLKLIQEQAKMMKSSNRLIAIATISAALLGAIVGSVLQYKLTQKPEITITQKSIPLTSSQSPK